jgi:hypothetical protein
MNTFESNCIQPLIIAASKEMPKIMEELVAAGANPSTIDAAAQNIVRNPSYAWMRKGASILDFVHSRLKALKDYKEFSEKEPEQLAHESYYTSGYEKSGYKYWTALNLFKEEKRRNLEARKAYERRLNDTKGSEGMKEKKEALSKLAQEFESLEKILLAAGAKTFKELHPEIPVEDKDRQQYNCGPSGKYKAWNDFII